MTTPRWTSVVVAAVIAVIAFVAGDVYERTVHTTPVGLSADASPTTPAPTTTPTTARPSPTTPPARPQTSVGQVCGQLLGADPADLRRMRSLGESASQSTIADVQMAGRMLRDGATLAGHDEDLPNDLDMQWALKAHLVLMVNACRGAGFTVS